MVVYVSGPYSGESHEAISRNIEDAACVATELWEAGHFALCPHLNTAHFEQRVPSVPYEQYIAGDLNLLARCDCIVMLPRWDQSKGAVKELAYAVSLGIPVYHYPILPALHPTEVRCPKQAQAFLEEVMRMYRVHLSKNADYSPANILGTGEVGLVTRMWDKVARLLNLYGFRFTIQPDSVTFDKPREPKHESVEDTLRDSAVYSVIGLLLRAGKWGV